LVNLTKRSEVAFVKRNAKEKKISREGEKEAGRTGIPTHSAGEMKLGGLKVKTGSNR